MRLTFLLLFLAAIPLTAQQQLDRDRQPPARPAHPLSLPPVNEYVLDNGLTVHIIRKETVPLVEMELLVFAGINAESHDRAGLAFLTNQMLQTGTTTRNLGMLTSLKEQSGITLFSATGHEYSYLMTKSVAGRFRNAAEMLADMVMHPAFPAEYLQFITSQMRSSLESQLNEVSQVASSLFYSQLYGSGHPYARTNRGTPAGLDSISLDDVRAFYASFYRPNNAHLIISGDVEPDAAFKVVRERFASWERGSIPDLPQPALPVQDSLRVVFLHDSGSVNAQIRIGNLSVPRTSSEFHATQALNHILGGSLLSRLPARMMTDFKAKPIIRSGFGYHRDAGFFVATGTAPSASVVPVVEAVRKEMKLMMTKPVTAGELAAAKSAIKKSYPLEFSTNGQLIQYLQDRIVFGLRQADITRYEEIIDSLTPDDIRRAAQLSLDPDRALVVIIGNGVDCYQQMQKTYPGRVRAMNY